MTKDELSVVAKKLRFEAIKMVYEGKDGHPGPAMSIADIVTTLYFDLMNVDPLNPDWEDRDRLIISKGHSCPIWYAALSAKGYYGDEIEHFHLRELGSIFQGHPVMQKTKGIDMTSGSLGNGIAIGAGMALAGKCRKKDYTVYVIVGDGELQEGVIWEGANLAAGRKLDNLIVFVDRNGFQSGGKVIDELGYNNPADKFKAFNWFTQEIDGHDYDAIKEAVAKAKENKGTPSAIICDCVKGKGVSYMENDNSWHKRIPTDAELEQAKIELGGDM